MRITRDTWVEVVSIINHEFVYTQTPLTVKLLLQAIKEVQDINDEEEPC